ncbi:MAG TPA: MBL fold metallo-hydrolase [Pseudomonadales bacterium]
MRRIVTAALALLVAAVVVVYSFRGDIAESLTRQAATRTMTSDPIADLPDGLHVALCGAGAPLPDAVRSGPCVAVLAGRALFIVDVGSNSPRNLQRMGLNTARVQAVLLTHFHSDHIDGLGELATLRWTSGSHHSPLPVHGPTGVEAVVAGFNAAYALDFGYRTAHHGAEIAPPEGAGSAAHPFAPPGPGESRRVLSADGLEITAFAVDHGPVKPAVGYRFDYRGRSLLVSGDTAESDNLAAFAEGVDLLVHEALAPHLVGILTDAARQAGRQNIAQITHDILDYHASPVGVAKIAAGAGAGHLLFHHVLPPLPVPGLEAAFLEGVADVYGGGVTVGRDGTLVSLPAGSDAIEVSALL